MVVGGGDSAFEEALFLTRFGTKVTLIHRRNDFRASQIMVSRARANPKIELLTPYVVEEVLGETAVTGLLLRNTDTGETREIDAQGFFVAIGHDPNTKLFVDQLDHDENGYLLTRPGSTETNIEGVFAVGDVQDHVYRQADHGGRFRLYGRARRRALPGGAREPHGRDARRVAAVADAPCTAAICHGYSVRSKATAASRPGRRGRRARDAALGAARGQGLAADRPRRERRHAAGERPRRGAAQLHRARTACGTCSRGAP